MPGLLPIFGEEKKLEDKIKKASTDCCAISPAPVTDEEAAAAFSVVGVLVLKCIVLWLPSTSKSIHLTIFLPPPISTGPPLII